MKYGKPIFTILLFLFLGSGNLVIGQAHLQFDSLGISITLPNSWTTQTPASSIDFFEAFSIDSSAQIRISKGSVSELQNSLTYLLQIESLLVDAGYTPVDLDGFERYKEYDEDSPVHAEDAAIGVYLFGDNEEYFLEYITVFHRENSIYLVIILFPSASLELYLDDLKLLTESFQIKP